MIFPLKIRSDYLKMLALIAMTLDHIDRVFTHTEWLSNTIGRMAFPIFAYLLIFNFSKYHPIKKYVIRLSFFALLTELVLFQFHSDMNNILFTFLYALIFLELIETIGKYVYPLFLKYYFSILLFFTSLSFTQNLSYGPMGFLFLISLYAYLKEKSRINYFAVLLSGFFINWGAFSAIFWTLATLILLLSGIKIVKTMHRFNKYFFYIYYPLHLLILYALKRVLEIL